jgi:sensor c-di-GMP phosphodiesterase-like protein
MTFSSSYQVHCSSLGHVNKFSSKSETGVANNNNHRIMIKDYDKLQCAYHMPRTQQTNL